MFAEMYDEIDRILTEDCEDVFMEMCCYFIPLPWPRRTAFWFHTFTRADGSHYRVAFLTTKFFRTLIWRCRILHYRKALARFFAP